MKTIDRRGFLKWGAAAAAWTPFSGMGAETPMTNKPIYIVDNPLPLDDPRLRCNQRVPAGGTPAPEMPFGADGTLSFVHLTDLHWTYHEWGQTDRERRFLDRVIAKYHPRFAVVTGDIVSRLWMGKTGFPKLAPLIARMFREAGLPFTITMGNHDTELIGPGWVTGPEAWAIFRDEGGKSFIDNNEPSLTGTGNGVIRVTADGRAKFDVYTLDSGEYFGPTFSYDGVRREQLDWVRGRLKAGVPSLFFQHIIVPEIFACGRDGRSSGRGLFLPVPSDAIGGVAIEGGRYALDPVRATGEMNETPCPMKYANRRNPRFLTADGLDLYDVWRESGCTLGAYFGHDHINSFDGVTDDGVRLGMTEKFTATPKGGYGPDAPMLRVFTLRKDGTWETRHLSDGQV